MGQGILCFDNETGNLNGQRIRTAYGTSALPGLAIGSTDTGFSNSGDASNGTIDKSLNGHLVGGLQWTRLPNTIGPYTATGTTTLGSTVVTSITVPANVFVGMGISGANIPANALVYAIDFVLNTVQFVAQGGATATGTATGTITFTDLGLATDVMGTQVIPCNVAIAGIVIKLNNSDWATPQDCELGTGPSFADSLALASESRWNRGYGAAMTMQASGHAAYGRTYFYNEARFAALSTTGNTVIGTLTIKSIPSTANIQVGALVNCADFPSNRTIVVSIDSGTQVTVSHPSTGSTTSVSVAFYNPAGAIDNGGQWTLGPKAVSGNVHTVYGKLNVSQDGIRTKVSNANTANPPTNAELVSAFGSAASAGAGFLAVLNDNGAGTNEYLCWSDGTNWFYSTGTKAV